MFKNEKFKMFEILNYSFFKNKFLNKILFGDFFNLKGFLVGNY